VKYALLALRTLLLEKRLEAIPMLDGHQGAALFVRFSDIPLYHAVRAWLASRIRAQRSTRRGHRGSSGFFPRVTTSDVSATAFRLHHGS
jgi:hypothetical protein